MIFKTTEEMKRALKSGDLYCVETGQYIFLDNEEGNAICVYYLSLREARDLERESRLNGGEYWGAYLGAGGSVYYTDTDYGKAYMKDMLGKVWHSTHDVLGVEDALEVIECPVCGKPLEAMEPTEENEWNYHCPDCQLDITIFAK